MEDANLQGCGACGDVKEAPLGDTGIGRLAVKKAPKDALVGLDQAVHVKGFTREIDWSCEGAMGAAKAFVDYLNKTRPSHVVFDGDDYSESSFTHALVDCVLKGAERGLEYQPSLVALVCADAKEHEKKCIDSWSTLQAEGELTVISLELSEAFTYETTFLRHGINCIRHTGARRVFTFGGGDCVKKELAELQEMQCGFEIVHENDPRAPPL